MECRLEYRRDHRQSSQVCAAGSLRKQYTFFHAEASHADAKEYGSSGDDTDLFELGGSQACPEILRQINSANKVAEDVAEPEHPASLPET